MIAAAREEGWEFDVVFVDADKRAYISYVLDLLGEGPEGKEGKGEEGGGGGRCLLRDGAMLLVDNTLWKGLVLREEVSGNNIGDANSNSNNNGNTNTNTNTNTNGNGNGNAPSSAGSAGPKSANRYANAPDPANYGQPARQIKLAQTMDSFNKFVNGHPQLSTVILPIRDGLSIVRYKAS